MLKSAVLVSLAISTAAYADDAMTAASPIAGPPGSLVLAPPPAPPAPPPPPIKTTNLQASPIGVMFGFYSVAASHALSSNIALSAELSAANTGDGDGTTTQVAVTLPLYFKRTFSGPFFEPGVLVHDNSYDSAYAGVEMMVGWTVLLDSGINVSGAIGMSRRIDNNDGESVVDTLGPAGYFRVGYAF